ncbi:MAG: 30S ribosomal protein S12 methylthiotransferase RimO, partial [Butyrivibrio sp.]|nr:30S ribosomal protein S12 methylthiotransferase RimO [Butyrivibrio sp.]
MRILFISLGCDKNRVDSEIMLGLLGQAGHTFTDDVDEAEAAIVNTCCFIGDAKKESVDTLLELADRRAEGMLSALIVTGCLAQRYQEEILTQIPEVDAVLGLAAEENIAETL